MAKKAFDISLNDRLLRLAYFVFAAFFAVGMLHADNIDNQDNVLSRGTNFIVEAGGTNIYAGRMEASVRISADDMSFALHSAMAVTPGWENVNPQRREVAPAKVVWEAKISASSDFRLEKRNGAEGTLTVSDDGFLIVEKSNSAGYLVITAPSFALPTGMPVRLSADVAVEGSDYIYSQAYLRGYGKTEDLTPCWELDTKFFSMGGQEEMFGAVNSAPGMTYRKYAHARVDGGGMLTPAVVVSGRSFRIKWKNWTAEDLDAADMKWKGYFEARTARDHGGERIDDEKFGQILANDVEHTAKLAKVDGITRLLIDGKVSVPVAYRAKGSFGADAFMETFAGGPLAAQGVKLFVKGLGMGGDRRKSRKYWSKEGFDAKGAAEDVRRSMRLVPDGLCVLSISCNAYPSFTLEEHPDEVWINKDGTTVRGTYGSCVSTYADMGIKSTNMWPWVSYASPAWRKAISDNIRALLAELRKSGLTKRIVGVHLSGYHDGQFYSPYEDHSACAKAEYEKYLKENPPTECRDYAYFSKLLGFRAQEEFARVFKRELGKDALAIRWCMSPFCGGLDLTPFVQSDVIDICVPQPTYELRRPAMSSEMKLPFSSFDLHCKMYWNEFDLRTYAALETWAAGGVVSTKGLGQSDDFPMWATVYRKHAGMMMARRTGYWFYDMGGGWYTATEIAADIGSVIGIDKRLTSRKASTWQPDVAIICDEAGLGADAGEPWNGDANHPFTLQLMRSQMMLVASSGVPYRFYLAEDVIRNPELVADCRLVAMSMFRTFDERRKKMVQSLANDGRTLLFFAEAGVAGGDEVTGFKTVYSTNSLPHELVAEKGKDADVGSYMSFTRRRLWPEGRHSVQHGPRGTVVETANMDVFARYASDGAPAIASVSNNRCRRITVCEPAGLTPAMFNRFAREAGAYVPVDCGGVEVDMNGDFVSMHAIRNAKGKFRLPRPCRVVNLRNGKEETVDNGAVAIELSAGETCWFELEDL